MTEISFPGLGIEPFTLHSEVFPNSGISIRWYGVIITVGMILAVLYALWHAKTERVKSDDVIDLALSVIIFGVLGARLYYVIMEFPLYLVTRGTFWENLWDTLYGMIAIWNGGLAIYGGIIGGFLAALVVSRVKRIKFPVIADIAGPSVIVGQIIGRWGNFVNVEAFGGPTELPWRMCSPVIARDFLSKNLVDAAGYQAVLDGTLGAHPTFLYESLWNLVGFVIITAMYRKKKFHGQMFLVYMTWYGFGRMLIEGLRTDSLYVGPLRVSQLVGAVTFLVGAVLLIAGLRCAKGKRVSEYVPQYTTVGTAEFSAESQKESKASVANTTEQERENGIVD